MLYARYALFFFPLRIVVEVFSTRFHTDALELFPGRFSLYLHGEYLKYIPIVITLVRVVFRSFRSTNFGTRGNFWKKKMSVFKS